MQPYYRYSGFQKTMRKKKCEKGLGYSLLKHRILAFRYTCQAIFSGGFLNFWSLRHLQKADLEKTTLLSDMQSHGLAKQPVSRNTTAEFRTILG